MAQSEAIVSVFRDSVMLWVLNGPQMLCVQGVITSLWHNREVVELSGGEVQEKGGHRG